jgi:hypothetical protein
MVPDVLTVNLVIVMVIMNNYSLGSITPVSFDLKEVSQSWPFVFR